MKLTFIVCMLVGLISCSERKTEEAKRDVTESHEGKDVEEMITQAGGRIETYVKKHPSGIAFDHAADLSRLNVDDFAKLLNLDMLMIIDQKNIPSSLFKAIEQLGSLTTLDLYGSGFDPLAMKYLKNHPRLEVIILVETPVSLRHLEVLPSLPKLKEVDLRGCQLSKNELEELKDRLGDRVAIVHDLEGS